MSERASKIPVVEKTNDTVEIISGGVVIARSGNPLRVREYGLAPVYYFPEDDVKMQYLEPSERQTNCPWKGDAGYFHISVNGKIIRNGAWKYPDPKKRFEAGRGHIAFYTGKMDACYLNGKLVLKQGTPGLTGWITEDTH